MRNIFAATLVKEAQKNNRIFLLTGDLGFTVFEEFQSRFPQRFLNVGVAEANMVGVASGLANAGFIPIAYSIATFISMRAFEQIRNDISLAGKNVKIVGVGAGLSYSHAGPTHHAMEDIALMRTLPGITIYSPSDPISTAWTTQSMLQIKNHSYLRLGKRGEPTIYTSKTHFEIGKGQIIMEGKHCTFLTTGPILYNVIKAAEKLKKRGISCRIIDLVTIKPIDESIICSSAKKTKYIFTVEEHSLIGGLGSIVAEVLAEKASFPFQLTRIGLPDKFCTVIGDHAYLRQHFYLSTDAIVKRVLQTIA